MCGHWLDRQYLTQLYHKVVLYYSTTYIKTGENMRLKEDSDNWKASNLTRKLKPLPVSPRHISRKDTKRWCGGHVGRLHDYYLVESNHSSFHIFDSEEHRWLIFRCATCRKELYQSLER
jgi:hypothetical protein